MVSPLATALAVFRQEQLDLMPSLVSDLSTLDHVYLVPPVVAFPYWITQAQPLIRHGLVPPSRPPANENGCRRRIGGFPVLLTVLRDQVPCQERSRYG